MKTKKVLFALAALILPGLAQSLPLEPTLASARAHAANAAALSAAYSDHVILPRKTPIQTAEARRFQLDAAAEALEALRRLDAIRAENLPLGVADLVMAGRCRLLTLDADRPSTQREPEQKSILEKALIEFSAAWKADPNDPAAWAGLLEVHRLANDKKAGEAVIAKAPPAVKTNPGFALAAGRFYLELEAAKEAQPFLHKTGDGSDALLYQAAGYYLAGDPKKAAELARAALDKRPANEAAALLLEHLEGMASPGSRGSGSLVAAGVAFEQRSDHGVSIFIYRKSAAAMPNDGRALYMLGESLAFRAKLLGRREEALAAAGYLERAMKAGGMPDVNREAALVPLAMAYQTAGQYDRAISIYQEIVGSDPGYYRFYFDLADCLRARGRTAEADRALARGRELAPKTTYVIGARFAQTEERIGTAGDCRAAAQLGPGDAAIAGRILLLGKPLAGALVQIFLDDCAKVTAPVESDADGRVKITLPAGRYFYNGIRIAHYPGLAEPSVAQMIYVPGKLDRLYETSAGIITAATKKPGEFEVTAGDNPDFAFAAVFVRPLKVTAPLEGARIAVTAAQEVRWDQVPEGHHYLVDFFRLGAVSGGELLYPIRDQISVNEEHIAIAALFAAGLATPQTGNYGVIVSAVDAAGQVIARSGDGLRRFTLE